GVFEVFSIPSISVVYIQNIIFNLPFKSILLADLIKHLLGRTLKRITVDQLVVEVCSVINTTRNVRNRRSQFFDYISNSTTGSNQLTQHLVVEFGVTTSHRNLRNSISTLLACS